MEERIIRVKAAPQVRRAGVVAHGPDSAAPLHVQNVRIDEGSAGQRLDNFLAKILKGVPRAHLYRVIRSGEVRVNKGRADADTRLALGDDVRIPPVRVADRSDRPEAPGREFDVVHEDEALLCLNCDYAANGEKAAFHKTALPAEEPLPLEHPLRTLPNTVITPHIGYVGHDAYSAFYAEALEDVEAFIAGAPIRLLAPARAH